MMLLDRVGTYTTDVLQAALFAAIDAKVLVPHAISTVYEDVDYTNQELIVKHLLEAGPFDPDMGDRGRPLIHQDVEPHYCIGALRALLQNGRFAK